MSLYQCYTWSYQIEVSPFDRLMDVLEAFFSSYPRGDFTRERREPYKLEFRRGMWKRMIGVGPLVPARLVPGDFSQWPVIVRVLARPSPEKYVVSVQYQLYLPRAVKTLGADTQSSVDQHIRLELQDLAAYLAECLDLDEPPAVQDAR